ncbi:hypothetical protein ISN75_06870 [Dyella marensis]|uniref:hypothetical protein n=1 Tax=Dyella marensis TaxID=500610 RepID=UPI0031E19119
MIDMTNPYNVPMMPGQQQQQPGQQAQPGALGQTPQPSSQPNAAMTTQQRMAIAQALMGQMNRNQGAGQIAMPPDLNGILPSTY